MPKLTFYGATGTVTGSRFLLETQGKKLLIDCGLFQGLKENRLKNWDFFPVPPYEINHIFLTHAHIDHSGYLPKLYKEGFKGDIYCTYATYDLCKILLMDTAHLQEEDAHWANQKGFSRHDPALPLFTKADARSVIELLKPIYYGEDLFLTDNLRIKLKDAGHILGSSFVEIKTTINSKTIRIFFSGDLGRPHQPILRSPVQAFNVDYLILESTYGNRLHSEKSPKEELAQVINQTITYGGVLVIPSFAVGRTQSLLYIIRELENENRIPILPIYVDSPMAIDATEIFTNHKGDYDYESKILELKGIKVMQPKNLKICRSREESIKINNIQSKAIIISASGMLAGGRILHHLAKRLPDKKNTILFIGYQAEGTRGRAIINGNPSIKIHGQQIPVNARIESISSFSAHADYQEILSWLMGFNHPPKITFLVHGEPEASLELKKHIEKALKWKVIRPQYQDSYNLD